jgi:hypothetical protein
LYWFTEGVNLFYFKSLFREGRKEWEEKKGRKGNGKEEGRKRGRG